MYKKLSVAILVSVGFAIGYSLNNIAVSNTNIKLAVVDTAKIISDSSEIKTLKSEQQSKLKAMQTTLEKAQLEISKETDADKAAKLEEKYREEINRQKIAMDENYNKRISDLNTKIHTVVANKAKSQNYDLVLPKDIVFWGGEDITADVEKEFK
jgi:outer membrane protein